MKTIDIYGVGNALVDMEYIIEDDFLETNGLNKGHVKLADLKSLYDLQVQLADKTSAQYCGGSAANTIYATRGFGASAFYSCRVADDELGRFFLGEMSHAGIGTNQVIKGECGFTGQCLVLITNDAQRTMSTYLGISEKINKKCVNESVLEHARFFYMEGYLASSPISMTTVNYMYEIARESGAKISIGLSDVSIVDNFQGSLIQMCGNGLDYMFCNIEEALAWCKTDRVDVAARELRDISTTVVITMGADGSLSLSSEGSHTVREHKKVKAVDTNGAGDMFAGAFLSAVSKGASTKDAARFANYAASYLVTQLGPRLPMLSAYHKLFTEYC